MSDIGLEPADYTASLDLDALSPAEREAAFRTWLLQCWLADNDPPQDEAGLAALDLDLLRRAFPHAYRAGDWQRMRPRVGATMVRVILYFGMTQGFPFGVLANRTKPIDEIERLRYVWHVPSSTLVTVAAKLLEAGSEMPVWLHDGRNGHVVRFRRVDGYGRWFSYDETTWPGGLSMLSEGQNAAGVAATRARWPDIGDFVVGAADLERVITGLTGPLPLVRHWSDLADQVEQLHQQYWRFGTLPPGWADRDLAHHAWTRALPGLIDGLGREEEDDDA